MNIAVQVNIIIIDMFSVIEDCLVHALYQTLMYHNWKLCRTQESKNKYRNALRKTFKRPHICQEVYEAVKAMKEVRFRANSATQFQKTCRKQVCQNRQTSAGWMLSDFKTQFLPEHIN